jgi:tripartite-type tricarboxylate transporter receptor subunit TctC
LVADETIHIVAPFARGGATDLATRIYADALAARLDVKVEVTNEPGDGGTRGAARVARAAPDGRTLVMGTSSTHGICSAVFSSVPYDWRRDFAPIAPLVVAPDVLVVPSASGIRSVADLIAAAHAQPGRLTFGSAGYGQTIHLCGELFRARAGIDIVHAPRTGSAAALEELAAGRLTMMFDNILSALPYVRSGALRALAVTSAQRLPLLSQVPTMVEAGIADYDLTVWIGLLARAATAESMLERLEQATRDVLATPDVRSRLEAMGAHVLLQSRAEFAVFIEDEARKWARAVESSLKR